MKTNAITELDNPLCECANCGLRSAASDLSPVHDFWSRTQPGEVIPHGDCPECGAFCYPAKEPEKRLTIHEAMDRLLKCPDLNHDSLEPESVAAIEAGFKALSESLTVRLFTLTSDTDSGMTTEVFDTEEAQLARMNELMAEGADENDIQLAPPGSQQWLSQWENWREAQMMDNNYYSWDEHVVTLSSRAAIAPVNRPEIRLFKIEPGVIPPDPDNQNDERADWAGRCLELFKKLTRCDEEDAVHDLITDLAHYCDRQETVDFNDELNHAANMYNEETKPT